MSDVLCQVAWLGFDPCNRVWTEKAELKSFVCLPGDGDLLRLGATELKVLRVVHSEAPIPPTLVCEIRSFMANKDWRFWITDVSPDQVGRVSSVGLLPAAQGTAFKGVS